jgi:hypothetical protein
LEYNLLYWPGLPSYAQNGNPGSIQAYFRENRIFMTGQFQAFFDPISLIIF